MIESIQFRVKSTWLKTGIMIETAGDSIEDEHD